MRDEFLKDLIRLMNDHHLGFDLPNTIVAKHMWNSAIELEKTNAEYKDYMDALAAESRYDDSMDGDHASALASAGWGTDEDYGGTDERL
jgi:hypothetical protein